jgi:hypothetical protein
MLKARSLISLSMGVSDIESDELEAECECESSSGASSFDASNVQEEAEEGEDGESDLLFHCCRLDFERVAGEDARSRLRDGDSRPRSRSELSPSERIRFGGMDEVRMRMLDDVGWDG